MTGSDPGIDFIQFRLAVDNQSVILWGKTADRRLSVVVMGAEYSRFWNSAPFTPNIPPVIGV